MAAKVGPGQYSMLKQAADVFHGLVASFLEVEPKQVRIDIKVIATNLDGHLDTLANSKDFMRTSEPLREVRWGYLKEKDGFAMMEIVKLKGKTNE